MEFNEFINDKKILAGIGKFGFKSPTPVQEAAYSKILAGGSFFVQAPTGSGKTLAYLLPLFEKYKKTERENKIVIVAPTTELALQIHRQAEQVRGNTGIGLHSVCLGGNTSIIRQIEKLKTKPQIIVGTSGRIIELIRKRKIAAHLVRTLVLDEGDRLFDKNNKETTDALIKCFVRDRQILLFSATTTNSALEGARAWDKEITEIIADGGKEIPANIKHWYVVCEKRNKLEILRGTTGAIRTRKAIIFVNGIYDIEETYKKLAHHHYQVDFIGGERKKEERKKAMQGFLHKKIKYLIATDIAARGLQFDDVDTVFHVNLPEDADTYIHRAGRTGRAGRVGRNLSIITERELPLIKKYEKALGIKFSQKFYYDGKLMDVEKEGRRNDG